MKIEDAKVLRVECEKLNIAQDIFREVARRAKEAEVMVMEDVAKMEKITHVSQRMETLAEIRTAMEREKANIWSVSGKVEWLCLLRSDSDGERETARLATLVENQLHNMRACAEIVIDMIKNTIDREFEKEIGGSSNE